MPRKLGPYRTPIKQAFQKYSEEDELNRFVFTVDPQCIITFPIDHCLYVCDICSSVLKTQDTFKKHYIKLHINHAHAALSDLKFCKAFPINLSKFKEDEGWFRCHFCIGLFFTEKSDLKLHLNQHDPLQKVPDELCLVPEALIKENNINIAENNGNALTKKMTPCNHSQDSVISQPILPTELSVEPPIIMTLNELLPLQNPNRPTPTEFSSSLPQSFVPETPKCNVDEVQIEPLSGLLGLSLLTLFNTSPNVLPDHLSRIVESTSSAHIERSSSPIFAQDCPISNKSFIELSTSSCPIECNAATSQSTSQDVSVVSTYYNLTSLPESLSLPPRENSNSSISSSSGFSSASTEDVAQLEENDAFERSEESFSSLTSSKSNSDEETTTISQNLLDINIDNIVLSCLFCDKIFASIKSTKTHMLKAHQSKGKHWECVFCKINFKNCDLLLNHLCSNHSDIYFACISCKVRFDTKAFMDNHFQNKHNSENTTNYISKLSKSKNKDDLLHQLKCIPYYTNQNIICNSLSRKIKLLVFNKLSMTSKRYNQKKVVNRSIQVSEDDLTLESHTELSQALNYTSSILKRKLTGDQSKSPTSSQNKVIKMSKDFNLTTKENNNFQSKLPVSLPYTPPSIESIQGVEVDNSLAVVDDFLSDPDNADKYLIKAAIKLELDPMNSHMQFLCLFCSKISSSAKGNNTHVARVHKMRRGGKFCSFCKSNFRTLDLLFNHLCSNHGHVYFACVFCKERFDSKSALMMHFDTEHDSVNINKETFNGGDHHRNPSDLEKELFMLELKCVPNYPLKPTCSADCKMCQSSNVETALKPPIMNRTIEIFDTTIPCHLENRSRSSKTMQDPPTTLFSVENPSLQEYPPNSCKLQNQMGNKFINPNQQEVTKHQIQLGVGLISSLSKEIILDSTSNAGKNMGSHLKLSSVRNDVICLSSTEISHLGIDENKGAPITLRSNEDLSTNLNCLFCDRTFDKAKAYRVHLFRSHKAKKNKCMFCKTEFSYFEDLFVHLLSNHSDDYFACNVCRIRFNAKSLLIEHESNSHNLVQALESNNVPDDVPILTEKVLDTTPSPNCVPELINDAPCSEVIQDKKIPLVELGLQPSGNDKEDENRKDKEETSTYSHQQLIKFNHPQYENIAMRNYSDLDITVQLQILTRVKDFTNGNQHASNYPLKRPLRQQKTSGTSGKREFSGEWARAKNYFCANCGSHFVNFWDFDIHRWNAHPNVSCAVYDFYVEDTPPCYFEEGSWPYNRVPKETSDVVKISRPVLNVCTKCGKTCVNPSSFHKHLVSCAQHNKITYKTKRSISWKEPDKPNKRKRRSCRGLKSILDTPPKLPPTHVFNTNRKAARARIRATNSVQKGLLSDKTNRRISFYNKSANTVPFKDSKNDLMLTRSRSVISNIDEKTKELIEKFERGKYNHNNVESFTRRLTKTKPKDCS